MHKALVCLSVASLVEACGEAPSTGKVKATLEQCVQYLAATACDRYETCQGHSDRPAFGTRDACERDYKQRGTRLWPYDLCAEGRVDEIRFETCLQVMLKQRCTRDPWDAVKIPECQPSFVCVSAPPAPTPPGTPEPTN